MGVDEGNLQVVIDVDVIMENGPITIPLRYILQDDYVWCLYFTLYLTFVTVGVRDTIH